MKISDNILRAHLQNVYFITGTACGGKTTVSRALSKKYGFALYDMDAHYSGHREIATAEDQPAMCAQFSSWEEYFCRPYQEYADWLRQSVAEQLQMCIVDLMELSREGPVFADLHISPALAGRIADPRRLVFLIAAPDLIARDYYERPDHRDLKECIYSLADPAAAVENCNRTLAYVNGATYEEVKKSGLFWIERTGKSTVEEVLQQVEEHFALS